MQRNWVRPRAQKPQDNQVNEYRGIQILRFLADIWNLIAFRFPYYALRRLVVLRGRDASKIWDKLPFKNMKSVLLLPDGNLLCCLWRDGSFWTRAIIEEIYDFHVYDKFFEPRKNFVVVDVGAHIGIYTLRAARKVGGTGQVIAVEPHDENHLVLTRNIRINRYKHVVPVKLALSDFEGKAKFYLKERSLQHSLKEKIDFETQRVLSITEVMVMTLSVLLSKLHIAKVDLLKVDAEGAEVEVLRGSEELLAQRRILRIALAAYHTSDETRVIKKYLEKFGYRVNVVEVTGREYLHAMCTSQEDACI